MSTKIRIKKNWCQPESGLSSKCVNQNQDETDTGIGMSEEIQRKLFTPQITSITNKGEYDKGIGISLLLAKGFVEKNGGEIWVESIEGKGSSFYFTLPASKPTHEN